LPIEAAVKEACHQAEEMMPHIGKTIFPGEGGTGGKFHLTDRLVDSGDFVKAEIIGCVVYKTYLDDPVFHHTRIAIRILRKNLSPISSAPQIVSAGDLMYIQDPKGGNDAD
jgi:hypothetical protein